MKSKKMIWVIGGISIVVIGAIMALILIKPFNKKADLNEIVGDTILLENATTYVYEFTDDMDDDFSQAFIRKTTMKIIEINEDSKIATVEFCVPDIEKIMLSELPTVETDDYDTLFSTYCSNINEAIANADEDDMITQTIECPVITDDLGSKISIEGAPLLNYQNILADILIDIINESEAE